VQGNFNKKSLERRKGYKEGVSDTVQKMSVIICYVLADKYGFGHKKLQQVVSSLNYATDSVVKGLVNINDFAKVLKDEHDIEVKMID
jgi:ribosomal protein S25